VVLGPVGLSDKIPFQLGPVWETLYWPVIVLSLVSITQEVITLIRPDRVQFYAAMKLITGAVSIFIFYLLSRVNEILVPTPGLADAAKFAEALRIVNMTLRYVMLFTAVMAVVECFQQIRRLVRVRRSAAPTASTSI
jgi:hypothetical protein